jgi:hypothetical protein
MERGLKGRHAGPRLAADRTGGSRVREPRPSLGFCLQEALPGLGCMTVRKTAARWFSEGTGCTAVVHGTCQ